MKAATEAKLLREIIGPVDIVQQYKSIEGDKEIVLKRMDRWAAKGWRLHAFGWANGFQGGWYALMVRDLRLT